MSGARRWPRKLLELRFEEALDVVEALEQQRDDLLALLVQAEDALGEYGFAREGPEQWDMMDEIKAAIARVRGPNPDA